MPVAMALGFIAGTAPVVCTHLKRQDRRYAQIIVILEVMASVRGWPV